MWIRRYHVRDGDRGSLLNGNVSTTDPAPLTPSCAATLPNQKFPGLILITCALASIVEFLQIEKGEGRVASRTTMSKTVHPPTSHTSGEGQSTQQEDSRALRNECHRPGMGTRKTYSNQNRENESGAREPQRPSREENRFHEPV